MAGQAAHAVDADAAGVEHGGVEGRQAEDALLVHGRAAHGSRCTCSRWPAGARGSPAPRVPSWRGRRDRARCCPSWCCASRPPRSRPRCRRPPWRCRLGIVAVAAGATARGAEQWAEEHVERISRRRPCAAGSSSSCECGPFAGAVASFQPPASSTRPRPSRRELLRCCDAWRGKAMRRTTERKAGKAREPRHVGAPCSHDLLTFIACAASSRPSSRTRRRTPRRRSAC